MYSNEVADAEQTVMGNGGCLGADTMATLRDIAVDRRLTQIPDKEMLRCSLFHTQLSRYYIS